MAPDAMKITEKTKKKLSILAIIAFALFSVAIFFLVGRPMLKFVSEPAQFRAFVEQNGLWSRVAFIGMMVFQVVIAIVPGEPLEIGAGYAFGIVEGSLLCLIGAVIGTLIVYLFVRYFGTKIIEVFFPVEKINSLKFLSNTKRLNLLVAIIFFIPGTPKDLITYVVGVTKIKLHTLLLITFFARIPSVITSTIGGDALGMQNYQFAIIVFVITILLSAGGLLFYRHLCKKEKAAAAAIEPAEIAE